MDIAEIEAGIKSYIDEKVKEGEGYFYFIDNEKELRLKLVRVHTEYLSNLGPNRHFACVDLADVSGDVYDVDFFLEGAADDMSVTQTTLHKLNGKPFYSWKQREDKSWYRIPMDEASTELLGVIEGKDEFEFNYQVILPDITGEAQIWLPLAESDSFQTIELLMLSAPGKHQILKETDFGNSILYLELNPENSGEKIEIVYKVVGKKKDPIWQIMP